MKPAEFLASIEDGRMFVAADPLAWWLRSMQTSGWVSVRRHGSGNAVTITRRGRGFLSRIRADEDRDARERQGSLLPRRRNRAGQLLSADVATTLRAAAPPALAKWLRVNHHDVTRVIADVQTYRGKREARSRGANPQCLLFGPLYDSEGRRYRIDYTVIETADDGAGPLVTSNLPGTFAIDRDYPPEFQARDLSSPPESAKIRKIASTLDPDRVLWAHSDPTLGAPVAWQGPDGRYYVLGGNGRTIAILMAPADRYAAYVDALAEHWSVLAPDRPARPGYRYVLVRAVSKADGKPLPLADAVKLAGASQESTAAGESPLGRALSLVRSLGISDVGQLPPFRWSEPLGIDNVGRFQEQNGAFWRSLMDRMDPARREAYGQAHKAVELIKQICVGFLPASVRNAGFGDEATEETLLACLPLMVSLESQIRNGDVKAEWSLVNVLPDAVLLYRAVQKMPKRDRPGKRELPVLLEREAAQPSLGHGAETLLSGIHLLGFFLGCGLANWSTLKDPSDGVTKVLAPYYATAENDHPGQAGMFFGGGHAVDPVATLAALLNLRIPARLPPGVRRNPHRTGKNPRRTLTRADVLRFAYGRR